MKTLRTSALRSLPALCLLASALWLSPLFTGRAAAQDAAPQAQDAAPPAQDSAPQSQDATPQAQDAAPTQAVIVSGRVFNVATGYYVSNAEVRIDGTNTVVYTGDGGNYTIMVPSGRVMLTASYTSTQPTTVTIDAAPGGRNVADFDLKPIIVDARATSALSGTSAILRGADDLVVLDRFVVTEERSGQARAIMTQRAAENAVTAIAIDNFGDLTSGSIGEFLKYMPGVTVDYGEDEAETVRVAGLDPKYASFTIDGIGMASSYGTSRANTFAQMSVTGIESIEFHQTLLARMPANSPAGKFELKTKYAFDRRKAELRFQLGLDGNSNAIEIGRSYMPDDKKHYRTYPGGQISYGAVFFDRRLGVEATISRYSNYRNNQSHYTYYTYRTPNANNPGTQFVERNGTLEMMEGPTIARLSWREGPKFWTQEAANLSIDFKATPHLFFSLRNNLVISTNEYYNSYFEVRDYEPYATSDNYLGPGNGIRPESTLTTWIVDPVSPSQTYGRQSMFYSNCGFRRIKDTNYQLSPRIEYKNGAFQANFRGAYASSVRSFRDTDAGFMRSISTRLPGLGWEATRSSPTSPEWYITQTYGTDWSQPQNFDRGDTYLHGTTNQPVTITNKQTSAYLDFVYALPILRHAVTLRAGLGYLYSDYYYTGEDNRFTYIGPEGRQQAATMPYTTNYVPSLDMGGRSGNVNDQGWRVNDLFTLLNYWNDHPDWFSVDTVNNARRNFLTVRDLNERIESGYVEAFTRVGRFSLNLGARMEHTRTTIMTARMRSWAEIDAAKAAASPDEVATGKFDYTTDDENVTNMTTLEGFKFQYYDGQRFPKIKDYTNVFFSGGLKYDITKNLRFQISGHQAILRPDYDNLATPMSYSPYYRTDIWIPNPYLKPENTFKLVAGFHYYFNPAGTLGLYVYRLDIKNLQTRWDYPQIITKEEAEYRIGFPIDLGSALGGGDDEGGDVGGEEGDDEEGRYDPALVVFRSPCNAAGLRTVYGMTVEYDQQLVFLPGVLKGLSLFGSFSTATMKNAREDWEKIGLAKTSASGGIRYRYRRFYARISATWTNDALATVAQAPDNRSWFHNDHLYKKARTIVDLSGGWRLNKNLELTFSIRNLTDSPAVWYSNVPERLAQYQTYGSIWNLAIRGTY